MFAYCSNNPVMYLDPYGHSSDALQWWSATMWWLCCVDLALPVGDIIYIAVIVVLGVVVLATNDNSTPQITFDDANTSSTSPTPNKPTNDDDDDDDDPDDDYYDDESNFGGRYKIGKNKGGTPGNNQAQNKQFKDATRGLSKAKQRQIHDLITKQHFDRGEVIEIAEWYR